MKTTTNNAAPKSNPFARSRAVNVPSDDIMFEAARPYRARSMHERMVEDMIREGRVIYSYGKGASVVVTWAPGSFECWGVKAGSIGTVVAQISDASKTLRALYTVRFELSDGRDIVLECSESIIKRI